MTASKASSSTRASTTHSSRRGEGGPTAVTAGCSSTRTPEKAEKYAVKYSMGSPASSMSNRPPPGRTRASKAKTARSASSMRPRTSHRKAPKSNTKPHRASSPASTTQSMLAAMPPNCPSSTSSTDPSPVLRRSAGSGAGRRTSTKLETGRASRTAASALSTPGNAPGAGTVDDDCEAAAAGGGAAEAATPASTGGTARPHLLLCCLQSAR
mmetsp:Transcript_105196/g.336620  ORF Transcript_105196/g.336620 Transcript_105196/m.336620 type:complete len:211 (+) Transcript_105196:726-1358(+)